MRKLTKKEEKREKRSNGKWVEKLKRQEKKRRKRGKGKRIGK